jgi:hypothetical protein
MMMNPVFPAFFPGGMAARLSSVESGAKTVFDVLSRAML